MRYTLKVCPKTLGTALYVLGSSTLDALPIRVTHWWPVGRHRVDAYKPMVEDLMSLDGRELDTVGVGPGSGCFREPVSGMTVWLIGEGQTLPAKTEETPVRGPKTTLETRWMHGRWEKLTKRGWVPA